MKKLELTITEKKELKNQAIKKISWSVEYHTKELYKFELMLKSIVEQKI